MENIKGILIDSGRVLNAPATGSWSYSPNFFKIAGRNKFNAISRKRRKAAFNKAWKYINEIKTISTLKDEWNCFKEFFNIISCELPELELSEEKKKLLDSIIF